jgi:hypothetical protein
MAAGDPEVAKTTATVNGMAADQSLIAALTSGTNPMRGYRPRHPPKWPAEDRQPYFARVPDRSSETKPLVTRTRVAKKKVVLLSRSSSRCSSTNGKAYAESNTVGFSVSDEADSP